VLPASYVRTTQILNLVGTYIENQSDIFTMPQENKDRRDLT